MYGSYEGEGEEAELEKMQRDCFHRQHLTDFYRQENEEEGGCLMMVSMSQALLLQYFTIQCTTLKYISALFNHQSGCENVGNKRHLKCIYLKITSLLFSYSTRSDVNEISKH